MADLTLATATNMNYKKIFLDRKFIIGFCLSVIICGVAVFGRMAGQSLTAKLDLNLGGMLDGVLGGVGIDVSTDGFSFSTGGGIAKQPGCGGNDCLVAPDPDEYAGIVISGTTTFRAAILKWTNFFLGFLALIAMIFLIYAGFLYVTAMGNDDQAKKAKNIIVWVVVGIIVIMIAYALVNTLITTGPTGRDY